MNKDITQTEWEYEVDIATTKLFQFIEENDYKGWDPYDGLNSKIFRTFGFNNIPFFRLAWIQFFKRSHVNFRQLMAVPKGYNAKGIGLILSAYSKLKIARDSGVKILPSINDIDEKIFYLGDMLINMQSKGYSGACWGYNFDWQARGRLYFKSNTPTVVATTYAAFGLFDAFEATGHREFLESAISSSKFVISDLRRDYRSSGTFLFSYSVGHGNNTVYNASLLGSKLLARTYHYNRDKSLLEVAKGSVMACVEAQEEDGSWVYGELPIQNVKDSYHTGFNLECIYDYMKYSGDYSVKSSLTKGLDFYFKNFFTEGGVPKYYHNKVYPIDIHSPAQLLVIVSHLDLLDEYSELVKRVLDWTMKNMKDKNGYFYYQKKAFSTSKIPYMRWSQSWMVHALSIYLIQLKK